MSRINSLVQKLASIAPKKAPLANSSVRSTHMGSVLFPLIGVLAVLASAAAADLSNSSVGPAPLQGYGYVTDAWAWARTKELSYT